MTRSVSNPQFVYEYSYNAAGRVAGQLMRISNVQTAPQNLDATYGWDNEGGMTAMQDPGQTGTQGGYTYQFDAMGRPSVMTKTTCDYWNRPACASWVAHTIGTATYGPAGELTSMTRGGGDAEPFTYNSLLQLTHQSMATVIDIQYLYPTGQNNGRISQSIDSLTGDTVNYSYDALNRLTHAETAGPQWGQSYTFDGFGNLTAKTVTKGTAFNWTNAADPCGPTLHPAT